MNLMMVILLFSYFLHVWNRIQIFEVLVKKAVFLNYQWMWPTFLSWCWISEAGIYRKHVIQSNILLLWKERAKPKCFLQEHKQNYTHNQQTSNVWLYVKIFLPSFVPSGDNKIIAAHQLSSASQTQISLQRATIQMVLQTSDVFLTTKKS